MGLQGVSYEIVPKIIVRECDISTRLVEFQAFHRISQ